MSSLSNSSLNLLDTGVFALRRLPEALTLLLMPRSSTSSWRLPVSDTATEGWSVETRRGDIASGMLSAGVGKLSEDVAAVLGGTTSGSSSGIMLVSIVSKKGIRDYEHSTAHRIDFPQTFLVTVTVTNNDQFEAGVSH